MNIKKLRMDSLASEVDAATAMEYETNYSNATIAVKPGEGCCEPSVEVSIYQQGMAADDLKEAIDFLKVVRRSLKKAVK